MEREPAPQRLSPALLTDLIAARELSIGLLERLRADEPAANASADALVALQEAANKLGLAEAILARPVSPSGNAPAPFLDASGPVPAPPDMPWSGEASAVMALAEFTIPYATGRADEAGRWLRLLRREGAVGRTLGDLGFPETEPADRAEPSAARDLESLGAVRDKAMLLAHHRQAKSLTTTDLLFAVLAMYGGLADRALYVYGITRADLLDRLSLGASAAATLPG
jgi:hypothetical protein